MASVTGLTAARMLEIEAASVVSGTVDSGGDLILTKHDGTTVNAGNVFSVMGYHPVTTETPPATATIDGLPVLWFSAGAALTPVPTTPTAPTFNYTTFAVTTPTVVGVEYQFYDPNGGTWTPIASGATTSLAAFTRPFTAKVRAVAAPGYVLTQSYTWEALFFSAGAFSTYASDEFVGTASSALAPAGGGAGRTLDMGLGGSASPTPTWVSAHVTEPGGLMITTSGYASKNTNASVDAAHGEISLNVGAANMMIEAVISSPFTPAHSRGFTFYMGCTDKNKTNGASVSLFIDSTTAVLRWNGDAGTQVTYRTSVTEAMILGTWKVALINKTIQLTAPDGQIFSKEFASSTFGTYLSFGPSDFGGTKQFATYASVKVSR